MSLLIAAIASLAIGVVLGLLGTGGSMLTLPMLVYVLDVPPRAAIAASLFVVCVTGLAGALAHAREGRVAWRVGAVFGLAGLLGAGAGARLARWFSPQVLLAAFSLVLLITALRMLRARHAQDQRSSPHPLSVPRSVAMGVGVGALSGLLGTGGGFLIVPALESAGGLELVEAIATSPFVTAIQSMAAFAGRLGSVELDWKLIGVISTITVVGSISGARLAHRLSPRTLRRGFAWLLLAVGLFVLIRQVRGR